MVSTPINKAVPPSHNPNEKASTDISQEGPSYNTPTIRAALVQLTGSPSTPRLHIARLRAVESKRYSALTLVGHAIPSEISHVAGGGGGGGRAADRVVPLNAPTDDKRRFAGKREIKGNEEGIRKDKGKEEEGIRRDKREEQEGIRRDKRGRNKER